MSDKIDRPAVIKVTASNIPDITIDQDLLAEINTCRYLLADKGYWSDSDASIPSNAS